MEATDNEEHSSLLRYGTKGVTTLSIMTFGIRTHSITTFSTMILSIVKHKKQHSA